MDVITKNLRELVEAKKALIRTRRGTPRSELLSEIDALERHIHKLEHKPCTIIARVGIHITSSRDLLGVAGASTSNSNVSVVSKLNKQLRRGFDFTAYLSYVNTMHRYSIETTFVNDDVSDLRCDIAAWVSSVHNIAKTNGSMHGNWSWFETELKKFDPLSDNKDRRLMTAGGGLAIGVECTVLPGIWQEKEQ